MKKGVNQNEKVYLIVKGSKKTKKRPFTIEQAIQLLTMANPSWELADEGFQLKGNELIKR